MPSTLAELARSDAPLTERLAVVRALAAAAEDLAARRTVHGGLVPEAVVVLEDGSVVLRPAGATAPIGRAGFAAPEVARGGRRSRRADAFSVGALAWLVLAGRAPFEAEGSPLETVRRVLFEDAPPVRMHAPGVPPQVDLAISALLEKKARRRGEVRDLSNALGAATAPVRGPPHPGPLPRSVGAFSSVARALASHARAIPSVLVGAFDAARALPPLPRTALALVPLFALSLAVLPRTDASLARDVASLLERGDVATARARVEDGARRRPSDPVIEKLRGDVACARGAPGECLRRYRVAIAARAELREDPALRANARRLLDRAQSCGTRRAAAQLVGELRDPDALPALEEARRSAGIFAVFCTGDAFDRAIAATRSGGR